MSKPTVKANPPKLTTPRVVARVQGAVARDNGGLVPKGSHVGRMQKAAVRNFGKPGGK